MVFVWCFVISFVGVGIYEMIQHAKYGGHDIEGLLTVMLSFPLAGLLYMFWSVITA
jgi:hypothetical protein